MTEVSPLHIYKILIVSTLFLCLFSGFGAELDSISLDRKPGRFRSPLYLKVLSVFEGKLYYDLDGKKPSSNSTLYKGIIKLSEPKTFHIRFLFESSIGDEKYFGPFTYKLSPPEGYSENIPGPSIPGGVYDSVLLISFPPTPGATIFYNLNDSSNFQEYTGQQLMLDTTSILYYRAVYGDSLSTDIYSEHYEILLEPPKVFLTTKLRQFNFTPKLKVRLVKANQAYFSLDPLAPTTSFDLVKHHIELPEGRHLLRIYATNLAGMRSKEIRYWILVDTKPPIVKYYVNTQKKVAHLQINEPGTIFYTTNGKSPNSSSPKYNKPIPLPENGVLPIRFFATDTLGNESVINGFQASSDITPPDIMVTPTPGIYNNPIHLQFTCNEDCTIRYTIDGKDPRNSKQYLKKKPRIFHIKKEGKTTIRFVGVDQAGNTTSPMIREYILDTSPPKVNYTLKMLASSDRIFPEFKTNEPSTIYFTMDGSEPTKKSRPFFDGFSLVPSDPFKFIAVDEVGNTTPVMSLDELSKPMAIVTPRGGVFNKTISISIRSPQYAAIQWLCTWNGQQLGHPGFKIYREPIRLDAPGVYILKYRARAADGPGNIYEQMYIIDKEAPRVIPVLEKGKRGTNILVRFETNEATQIFYTLNGIRPSISHSRSIGSVFLDQPLRLNIQRNGKTVLKYMGVDAANNRTPLYVLDLFSPHVTLSPPPGTYHNIISLKLQTQQGNTIFYSSDSATLSASSSKYTKPLILSQTSALWFFAVDITGYNGPKQRAVFKINLPPTAQFVTTQNKVFSNTPFQLDGSLSSIDKSQNQTLNYRWDLNGDGLWDTPFTPNPLTSCLIKNPGIYSLQLEVKDDRGLTAKTVLDIHVHKRCPTDMVSVTKDSMSFCIDRYEWPGQEALKPTTNVNWAEAAILCKSKDRRLCLRSEWSAACRGVENHRYPYGDTYQKKICATQEDEPVPGAQITNCVSRDGVFSLVGNVWEWLEDTYSGYHTIAGGSYTQAEVATCDLTLPSPISTVSKQIGFRCCQ